MTRDLNALATHLETLGDVRRDEAMSRHTTFGVGGPADIYVTVRSTDALAEATRVASEAEASALYTSGRAEIEAGVASLNLGPIEVRSASDL